MLLLVSWVILFTPESGVPSAPPGTDKVIHFVLFGLLTVTGRVAGFRSRALLPAMAGYAAISELLQAILPIGRSCELADAVVDCLGAVVFWAIWTWRANAASSR